MTWTNFSNVSTATGPQIDADLQYLSNNTRIPCTIAGTNTLVFTTSTNMPTLTGYVTGMKFGGVVTANNSGPITIAVNGLTALNGYIDQASGPQLLVGGELAVGNWCECVYDAALNSGAGGFHVSSDGSSLAEVPSFAYGFTNKFRNAPLDIWARGTSITVTPGGATYTADGWQVTTVGANATVSQVAGRLLTKYSAKILGATSMSSTTFSQRIESNVAVELTSQVVTIQGWIYNSTGGAIVPTLTVNHANAVDNFSAVTTDVNAVSLTSCPNGSWTQVKYTWTASASAGNGMEVIISAGSSLNTNSNYIQFAEFDIRKTPGFTVNAIPSQSFVPELRRVSMEKLICDYYLPGINTMRNSVGPVGMLMPFGATSVGFSFDFMPATRIAPTSIIMTGASNTLTVANIVGMSITPLSIGPTFMSASTQKVLMVGNPTTFTATATTTAGILINSTSTTAILFGGAEL